MKEATIYYTEIVGGKKREQHLCEECAAELTSFHSENPLESILSGLFSMNNEKDLVCKRCGLSYQEFRHNGKFGCSDCYQTFERFLQGNLKRIQGATIHTGKVGWRQRKADEAPVTSIDTGIRTEKEMSAEALRAALKQAVAAEEYEEAARLRDKLRAMEQEGEAKCQQKD